MTREERLEKALFNVCRWLRRWGYGSAAIQLERILHEDTSSGEELEETDG